MASRARKPAAADVPAVHPEPVVDDQAVDEPTGPPDPTCWEYQGPERLYMHIPVTVRPGDVIKHAGPPADDGCWTPHDGPATRHPDNHTEPAEEVSPDA